MATHFHKALAAGVALCSAACQEGTPVRDLTEEEEVMLEERFDQIEAALPFVEHLGASANAEFAFGGKKAGAAHFISDVQTTFDYLLQKMGEGNIFVFKQEDFQLHPEDGAKETDRVVGGYHHDALIGVDYVALPEGGTWSTGDVMHEGGHALCGHSKVIDTFVAGESYRRPDSIEAIDIFAAERDISYLLSAYFTQVEFEMGSIESDIRQVDVALDALRQEDDDIYDDDYEVRTQQWVSERNLAKDKEGWIDARTAHAFQTGSAEYWHHIGITEDEYREALRKSTIYEYGREKFDEKYAELKAEIQKERMREASREHSPKSYRL